MRRLTSFTTQSIDGFYKGPGEDISWHRHGPEETRFSEEQLALGDTLVFGRRTYEMMAAFWPTDTAARMLPAVAEGMNRAEKIVVSDSLGTAPWGPVRIIGGDVASAFRELKAQDGPEMTILGSGELLRSLVAEGLVDAVQIMIYPVAIGWGTTLFEGRTAPLDLTLTDPNAVERQRGADLRARRDVLKRETAMQTKTHYVNAQPVLRQDGERLTYFFKTGRTKAEGLSTDGVMQGEWRFWRETGELWQVCQFRDGKKHGAWLRYARDGAVEYRDVFEAGKLRKKAT